MNHFFKKSLHSSLQSSLLIVKFIVPLYILSDILLYFDLLSSVSFLFYPITSWLGLPVEAGMAMAAGVLLNLYAAIAFAAPLELDSRQWTVLAVFLGVCHSMVLESVIMKQIGISYWYSVVLRLSMAFVSVVPVMLMPQGFFDDKTHTGVVIVGEYDSFLAMLGDSIINAIGLSVKVILLISLLIIVMDGVRRTRIFRSWSSRVNILYPIIVGQLLGITYGAGILIRETNSGSLTRRDIFFIATFLMICHSIIEDTLLFVIFGANYLVIITIRIIMAILVSFFIIRIFSSLWLEKSGRS